MKIYAMSDLHGCLPEFETVLKTVDLSGDNVLVLLGDYIHGPDSYGVLDKIIKLQEEYGTEKVIALRGNHEEMALEGTWPINETRLGAKLVPDAPERDLVYLRWMETLPRYYLAGNAIFVHAGIDEEAAVYGYWELGTEESIFTGKFPAETGKIENFDQKIVAGHVGTYQVSGDSFYHGIFYDGGSHYYIDGTVHVSGEIPVLMYDTDSDRYYRVTKQGASPILPYKYER